MGHMTDIDADRSAVDGDEAEGRDAQRLDREALARKLKAWYRADRDASSKWRIEAREDRKSVV